MIIFVKNWAYSCFRESKCIQIAHMSVTTFEAFVSGMKLHSKIDLFKASPKDENLSLMESSFTATMKESMAS